MGAPAERPPPPPEPHGTPQNGKIGKLRIESGFLFFYYKSISRMVDGVVSRYQSVGESDKAAKYLFFVGCRGDTLAPR